MKKPTLISNGSLETEKHHQYAQKPRLINAVNGGNYSEQ